jgi:hypothetical protein
MIDLKSYLASGTKDSMMRLTMFVIVINSSVICLTVSFVIIYTLITAGDFKNISELIKACAYFIVGLLGPISVGKSIQSFGERNSYNIDDNNPFGGQQP